MNFSFFCRKSWRKFHRCVFSVKEGTELLVCLKINYRHYVVLQKMIVAHLLGEFIAFFSVSLLVSAMEPYPESAPFIPSYIQLLHKIQINFNVSSTSCSSKCSHLLSYLLTKNIYTLLIFSFVCLINLHFVAVKHLLKCSNYPSPHYTVRFPPSSCFFFSST